MHHGRILPTPSWVEASRHIHTQTHTDFLVSDTKLHNRQKEFTATPASRVLPLLRASGRCPELSGPVQNGHEQSFREHSHFLLILSRWCWPRSVHCAETRQAGCLRVHCSRVPLRGKLCSNTSNENDCRGAEWDRAGLGVWDWHIQTIIQRMDKQGVILKTLGGTIMDFSGGSVLKRPPGNEGDSSSIPRSGGFPWRRAWQPTPVFLPGESHGLQSTASQRLGYGWAHSRHGNHKAKKYEKECVHICITESLCCTEKLIQQWISTPLQFKYKIKWLSLRFHNISCGCQGSWCIFCSEKMNHAAMKEVANSCWVILITGL